MKKTPPRSRRKRPTATLDLKAKEVKKNRSGKEDAQSAKNTAKTTPARSGSSQKSVSSPKGTPAKTGSEKSSSAPSATSKASSSRTTVSGQQNKAGKTASSGSRTDEDAAKRPPTAAPKAAPVQKSGGGFVSHLLACHWGRARHIWPVLRQQ